MRFVKSGFTEWHRLISFTQEPERHLRELETLAAVLLAALQPRQGQLP